MRPLDALSGLPGSSGLPVEGGGRRSDSGPRPDTVFLTPPPDLPDTHRAHRKRLRARARWLTSRKRVKACGRLPLERGPEVVFDDRGVDVIGTAVCSCVHECAVCRARIGATRTEELARATTNMLGRGWHVYLVSATIRHTREDTLHELVRISDAHSAMLNGSPWRRKAERWGGCFVVRALDATHSERNGWHLHIHSLMFVRTVLGREDVTWMRQRWETMTVRHIGAEHRPSWDVGLDVQLARAPGEAAQYVLKLGLELTQDTTKKKSRTPWTILEETGKSARARELWAEWCSAMYGRKLVAGMTEAFRVEAGINDEEEDDAIAARPEHPVRGSLGNVALDLWWLLARDTDAKERWEQVLDIELRTHGPKGARLAGAMYLDHKWRNSEPYVRAVIEREVARAIEVHEYASEYEATRNAHA